MNKFFSDFFFKAPNRGFFCVTKQAEILHAQKRKAMGFLSYL